MVAGFLPLIRPSGRRFFGRAPDETFGIRPDCRCTVTRIAEGCILTQKPFTITKITVGIVFTGALSDFNQ